MLWPALVLALAAVAWWIFQWTAPTGEVRKVFFGEMGAALLGSSINAATAGAIAYYALSEERRRRRTEREFAAIKRESARRHTLSMGRLKIENTIIVAATRERGEPSVVFDFDPLDDSAPKRQPQGWAVLEADRLSRMKHEAACANVPFTDDPAVDMVSAGITQLRRHSEDGKTHFRVVPRLTSYHLWAATSARLDDPLSEAEKEAVPGEGETLRERFAKNPTRLEDVLDLPSPAKIGVGVVVVTADNQMVLGLRGRTFVASNFDTELPGGHVPVHFVAEGMSPQDRDENGRLSPDETALRGMFEELGIEFSTAERLAKLRQTGVFFDTQRWQPCFAYVAHLDMSFDELLTTITSAADFWEADQIIPLPFDPDNPLTKSLMLGVDGRYCFASNHAHALAYFALLHQYGLRHMQDAMRGGRVRARQDGAEQLVGRSR